MNLTPNQRRVFELVRDERHPVRIPEEVCSRSSLLSMERLGIVRVQRNGVKITQRGRSL